MIRKTQRPKQTMMLTAAACASLAFLATGAARAQYTTTYQVSLNTSNLSQSGAYSIDFQLNNGGTANSSTGTLSNFSFGTGGSATGTPQYFGGASGSTNSTISLADSSNRNEFTQTFTPGTLFRFNLALTASDFSGIADQFSFTLLSNNTEITTYDLGNGSSSTTQPLLAVDLYQNGPEVTRRSDAVTTVNNQTVGDPNFAPLVTPTPAPPGLIVAGIGLLIQGVRMRRRA